MANTVVRTVSAVFPATDSTFDVTVAGESRNATGAFIIGTMAEALNTSQGDHSVCFGATDFTTSGVHSCNDEDNAATTQNANHKHSPSLLVQIQGQGFNNILRTATATAISGGIRIDPGETGTAWRIVVILVFGSECKAFNAGNGTAANTEYDVPHGFSTAPGAGIYGFGDRSDDNGIDSLIGIGFHAYDGTIQQACMGTTGDSGATTTAFQVRTENDKVGTDLNPGSLNHTVELTSIDATNISFTPRSNTQTGALVGLLIECDDVSSAVAYIDSPTSAAADWDYTGLSFTPQFVSLLLNRTTSAGGSKLDADAGPFGVCTFDEDDTILTANWRRQDAIVLGTTNNASRIDQDLRFMTHSADTATHDMDNPSLTASGFSFAAADITTANGTVRKWPMLAIETSDAGANEVILTDIITVTDGSPIV